MDPLLLVYFAVFGSVCNTHIRWFAKAEYFTDQPPDGYFQRKTLAGKPSIKMLCIALEVNGDFSADCGDRFYRDGKEPVPNEFYHFKVAIKFTEAWRYALFCF